MTIGAWDCLLTRAGVNAEDAGSEQEGAMFRVTPKTQASSCYWLWGGEGEKQEYVRFKSTVQPTENNKCKNNCKKSTRLLLILWYKLMKKQIIAVDVGRSLFLAFCASVCKHSADTLLHCEADLVWMCVIFETSSR